MFGSRRSSNHGCSPATEVLIVSQTLVGEEAVQLPADVNFVRMVVDTALVHGLDRRLVDECTSLLRERHERPEELELERTGRP